ncbi:MAG: hypothetical protein JXB48_11320 [Candidatus Latescibacteria bacterium]|nr:hypothetical protein [Candidatus Latescibacterota bacterium]
MKITINLPDDFVHEIKAIAAEQYKSVSSIIAEATQTYIQAEKRRIQGNKILDIIKTAKVSPDALRELEREREMDVGI